MRSSHDGNADTASHSSEQAPIGPRAEATVQLPGLDPLVQRLGYRGLIDLDTGEPSPLVQFIEDICYDEPLEQIAEAWGNSPDGGAAVTFRNPGSGRSPAQVFSS